jgi:hypothetical protein
METYDVASQTNGSPAPIPIEDEFTKNIESYTAAIPSSTYLGVAAGAIALSLFCQITGRGKWGNFIAQWVPTWLIIGVYNKVVKLEGHDRFDRGETINDRLGDYSCEFCDSKFSVSSDLENHKKHCSVRTPVS